MRTKWLISRSCRILYICVYYVGEERLGGCARVGQAFRPDWRFAERSAFCCSRWKAWRASLAFSTLTAIYPKMNRAQCAARSRQMSRESGAGWARGADSARLPPQCESPLACGRWRERPRLCREKWRFSRPEIFRAGSKPDPALERARTMHRLEIQNTQDPSRKTPLAGKSGAQLSCLRAIRNMPHNSFPGGAAVHEHVGLTPARRDSPYAHHVELTPRRSPSATHVANACPCIFISCNISRCRRSWW